MCVFIATPTRKNTKKHEKDLAAQTVAPRVAARAKATATMSLREAIHSGGVRLWKQGASASDASPAAARRPAFKTTIHEKLLERFDIRALEHSSAAQVRVQLKAAVEDLLAEESYVLTHLCHVAQQRLIKSFG